MDLPEPGQLAWETNRNGTVAHLHRGMRKTPGYGYGVKLLTISKMMDVAVISGDIKDATVVFEPWVAVAADRGASIEFCGLYQRAFDPEEGTPDFCLRRSRWDEATDRSQFRSADDKLAYLLTARQVTVETVFGLLAECPRIGELANEVETILLEGYSLQHCQRDAEQRSNLYLKVVSKSLPCSWDVTYFLGALHCEKLEDWTNRWLACAQSLDTGSEFVPARGTQISYRATLFDRLKSFQP